MPVLRLSLLIAALIFLGICSRPAMGQNIGILANEPAPTPEKPTKKPPTPPRRPVTPRRPTTRPDPTERVKRRVTLTITSDPVECEVYLNDTYRGTTATRNGKLVIPDLDPTLTYTLRVYKRGIGEELQDLDLSDDQDLEISLKKDNEKGPETDNKTNPEVAVKDPPKDPEKPPEKPPEKQPENVAEVKPPVTNPEPPTKPITTAVNNSSSGSNNSSTVTTPVNTTATTGNPATVNKSPVKPVESEMVLIPAGEFNMGVNKSVLENNKPQHKVNVAAFYIDAYEVTNADYKLFCDATKHPYPTNPAWDKDYFLNKPNYPVVNVSWYDANDYAKWVGKRLPTEEEWEKAARGAESRLWPWGKDFQPILANLDGKDDGYEFTAPIGSFRSGNSPYGVYDMVGNVWEWTSSAYKSYPGGKDDDKRFQQDYRVIRGGGYQSPPMILGGAAFRFPSEPNKVYEATGFRCARSQ